MDAAKSQLYDGSFKRLASMQGGDPAFFVLAVHSFIEGVLKSSLSLDDPTDEKFTSFLQEFRQRLIGSAQGFIQGLDVLNLIKQQHLLTNDVRHRFASATVEDARAATQHLRRFCQLARIPEGEGLATLIDYLKAWDDRRSYAELVKDVNDLGYRYQIEKKSAKEMAERVSELETAQVEMTRLKEQIRAKDQTLVELEVAKERKDVRVDELRAERAALVQELKQTKAKATAFDDAQAYIDTLSRMTVLTRTRADYERSIIRLTAEQKRVLEQIRLDADFLVKGAAGTGKTLVLLKAIEKAKGGGLDKGLGLDELSGSIALLTYTRTLVKYDLYLASLLSLDEGDRISTADSFLQDRLREIEPKATIVWKDAVLELAAKVPFPPIDPKELASEAEIFVWGNLITREEYIDKCIDRKGMKRPLARAQRGEVWKAVESLERIMRDSGRWSRNLAAREVAKAATAGDPRVIKVDYVFIDEAQDLPPSVLAALRGCARRCAVLAGDADQSIFQPFLSFKRAGIDIAGRTRVLKTNFRNTVPIHEFAERFRSRCPGLDTDNQPEAFRDGPAPEVFLATDQAAILDLVVKRVDLFIRRLGYDPENICVIGPTNDDLAVVSAALSAKGYANSSIKDEGFSFAERGAVRLCTIHSAKGLDFPVVFVYLPKLLIGDSTWDPESIDRQVRNLLYVSITRAMDHCNIFTREATNSVAVKDLISASKVDAKAE